MNNQPAQPNSRIDYDRLRRLVVSAFSTTASPSYQSPMADWQTNRRRPSRLYRHNLQYPNQPENTCVHATETRSPTRRDWPIGRGDREAERLLSRIAGLDVADRTILDYCYNQNSIGSKPFLKNLVWRAYLPAMAGRNAETKGNAVMVLDSALPCYRDWVMTGRDLPTRPWLMFSTITPRVWRRTYRTIWIGLHTTIRQFDEQALACLR